MADLCPDPDAYAHSGCGYPSGAQPDTYVNEEWFGLFAIAKPQCQAGLTLTLTRTRTRTLTLPQAQALTLTLTRRAACRTSSTASARVRRGSA